MLINNFCFRLSEFVHARERPYGYARFIMISLVVVSALALSITLAVQPGSDSSDDTVHSDTTTLARVVFYGPEGGQTDLLGQPAIFVNGVAYARLVRGTYFYIAVPPGPVTACIDHANHECHTIQAVQGKVYYFKATYPYPLGYNLSRVDSATGEAERSHKANSPIPQHLIRDKAAVEFDLE